MSDVATMGHCMQVCHCVDMYMYTYVRTHAHIGHVLFKRRLKSEVLQWKLSIINGHPLN